MKGHTVLGIMFPEAKEGSAGSLKKLQPYGEYGGLLAAVHASTEWIALPVLFQEMVVPAITVTCNGLNPQETGESG